MRRVCLMVSLCSLMACDKNATLVLRDRGAFEARIIDGDERELVVVNQMSRRVEALPREQIISIDHPGDAAIWTGVGIIALSAVQILSLGVLNQGALNRDEIPFVFAGVAPILGIGGLVLITGLSNGAESRRNTYRSHPEPPASGLGWLFYFE